MPPRTNVRAPASKNTAHSRTAKAAKSLKDVYLDHCRDAEVHPNSAFESILPDKSGSTLTVETLDLSRNYVGDKGMYPVIAVVQRCSSVKKLILRENGLRNSAVKHLCHNLARHPALQMIDLSHNYISEGARKALIEFVQENTKITEVALNNTKLEVEMRMKIKQLAAENASRMAEA